MSSRSSRSSSVGVGLVVLVILVLVAGGPLMDHPLDAQLVGSKNACHFLLIVEVRNVLWFLGLPEGTHTGHQALFSAHALLANSTIF